MGKYPGFLKYKAMTATWVGKGWVRLDKVKKGQVRSEEVGYVKTGYEMLSEIW